MNDDLRALFIKICENYKNITDIFVHLGCIIDGDVWDTRMGAEVENLFTTIMEFFYKSRYPDINAVGSLYPDFIKSIYELIFNDATVICVDDEDKIVKNFESLWELWFNTTGISTIRVF